MLKVYLLMPVNFWKCKTTNMARHQILLPGSAGQSGFPAAGILRFRLHHAGQG